MIMKGKCFKNSKPLTLLDCKIAHKNFRPMQQTRKSRNQSVYRNLDNDKGGISKYGRDSGLITSKSGAELHYKRYSRWSKSLKIKPLKGIILTIW